MKNHWIVIWCCVAHMLSACGGASSGDNNIVPPTPTLKTVTATATQGGTVSPRSVEVMVGQATSFRISADLGYDIAAVTGCDGALAGTEYRVSSVQEGCNVHVQFQQKTYPLTVKTNGAGQVSPSSSVVAHGSVGRIIVTPAAEHDVVQVVSSCGGSYQQGVYTTEPMQAACAVTIDFGQKELQVLAVAGAGGSVSPSMQRVAKGQTAQVSIQQHNGYKLKTVSGCDGRLDGLLYKTAPLQTSCRIDVVFNGVPTAVIAAPNTVAFGGSIVLNGQMSSDPDGDLIHYTWQVITAPATSTAQIRVDSPDDPTSDFTPDKVGNYVLGLTVSDAWHSSVQTQLNLQVSRHNNAPIVWISAPLTAKVGEYVKLDGARSRDLDNDPMHFHWSFKTAPSGAKLEQSTLTNAYFVPTTAGEYVVQLQVSDDFGGVATDTVAIRVVASASNQPPQATVLAPSSVAVRQLVSLSAQNSRDADGDALDYYWRFVSKPAASQSELMNMQQRDAQFRVDVRGSYVIELIVNDHAAQHIDHVTVEAY